MQLFFPNMLLYLREDFNLNQRVFQHEIKIRRRSTVSNALIVRFVIEDILAFS